MQYASTEDIVFDIEVDFGTSEEDAIGKLAATVGVVGTNGEEGQASIAWTIADYNANEAGDYTATGKLTLPEGWTGAPADVTATVTVKAEVIVPIAYASTEDIVFDIEVDFGTSEEDAIGKLAATVGVVGTNGEEGQASIAWTIADYNANEAGDYTATGKLTLPEGWTGAPADVTATVTVKAEVIVPIAYASTEDIVFDIEVDFGTSEEDAIGKLAATVGVVGTNGEEGQASIAWTIADYNANEAGDYTATGKLTLPEGWTGAPADVTATVTVKAEVIVPIAYASTEDIVFDIEVDFGTSEEDAIGKLAATVGVVGTNGEEGQASIAWTIADYNANEAGDYTATGKLTLPEGWTGAPADVTATVTVKAEVIVPIAYASTEDIVFDIEVDFGTSEEDAIGKLAATVGVVGTNGEEGQASIAWTIADYNANEAGDYTATGKLTLPEGWTGAPADVTATVTVKAEVIVPIAYASTEDIVFDIEVDFGTSEEDAIGKLAATVGVVGTNGEEGQASIAWTIADYNANEAGDYTATGKLTLPEGWTGAPADVTATVTVKAEVIVPIAYASTEDIVFDIEVDFGTSEEDAIGKLAATVGVVGTNGEEGQASIAWTIADYNANEAGDYTATGKLTLPEGWTGAPADVTATVTVKAEVIVPIAYASTEDIVFDIEVDFGTSEEDAIGKLAATVGVVGTNGEEGQASIAWTIADYNANEAGDYTATGKLTLPEGWTGAPADVTATVTVKAEVIVPIAYASTEDIVFDIEVDFGTSEEDAIGKLAATVGVVGTNGEEGQASIAWTIADYNANEAGDYTATGKLTLPEGWTGAPADVTATVTVKAEVIVPIAYASTEDIVFDIEVDFGTSEEDAIGKLAATVGVVGTNGEEGQASIAWTIADYNANEAGDYTATGKLTLPEGWTGAPADVTATVTVKAEVIVPIAYASTEDIVFDIEVDFGTSEEDAIGKLAATVGVVGTNGEEGQASIAWTIADYNANEAGDYTATGKLTLPEGWTGAPADVTATVTVKAEVIVPIAYASTEDIVFDIEVDFGTSEEDAIGKLAATVGVVGTNGEEGQASIAWTIADYNANEAGDYTATGKLTLPEGWTGAPADVTATVTVKAEVIVPIAYASTEDIVFDIEVDFGTSEEDAIGKLAATVGVVGTNGEEGQASIAWTIADYNANEAGDYTATGKLTLPEGWTGAPADVTATVTVKAEVIVPIAYASTEDIVFDIGF
ncbi:MAG: hypothetical protein ACOX3O_01380 [bacterium]